MRIVLCRSSAKLVARTYLIWIFHCSLLYIFAQKWREPRVVFSGSRACSFRLSCIGLFLFSQTLLTRPATDPRAHLVIALWRKAAKLPLFGHFCAFRFYWKCAAKRNIIWCFVYALSKSSVYEHASEKGDRFSLMTACSTHSRVRGYGHRGCDRIFSLKWNQRLQN